MNKYQEALHNLMQIEQEKNTWNINSDDLSELVDKATPKKPFIDSIKFGDKPCEIYHCVCGCIFLFKNNFCPQCGQALDWSEN